MTATKNIDKTILSTSYIPSLTAHTATFMSARSKERSFLPARGAHWWLISFSNPIALEQFIAQLFSNGFYGDIEVRGNDIELQTKSLHEAFVINSYCHPEAFPIVLSQLTADAIFVENDSHALLCNQRNNGALSYTGERLVHLQFSVSPSSWSMLNILSQIISIHAIVHFDPTGYMILKATEAEQETIIRHLESYL
ncbi:hypothetical protein L4D00_14755 [Photobacterium swingsii]|uniref:Uncharacterized protein n=1 Tax=Photobacterium swingsii TaxID=680026 RepID=A0A0J8VDD7_9GAMM|nr:hypothetical protein [Photobacterium swingsii]KMV31092.1 hypothetical protein AB733_08920 [Photobacterium swingsii]PSW23594.1 hypothetical protein C9I94_15870 [Photobacterium swingsii]